MKCFILEPNYGCDTHSGFAWSLAKDRDPSCMRDALWDPREETQYEIGGNTWSAAGPITADSKNKIASLWIHASGSRKPLGKSHVIGDFVSSPTPHVVVDATFVEAVNKIDEKLFDFTSHNQVIDSKRQSAPWRGEYFIATLLPMKPSYDLELSDLKLASAVRDKYQGKHASTGARRVIAASKIIDSFMWRDSYTRDVLCTQYALDFLKALGVQEWKGREVEVIDD